MRWPPTKKTAAALVLGLLLAHAILVGWSATLHSPSNDEVAHLPAGISHWRHGCFDLYTVNPPLVRMLAALPVVAVCPKTDWKHVDSGSRSEWEVGADFVKANGQRSWWFFTLARWACLPLSLLAGYVCYHWASALYGRAAGLLALALWCFDPNVIAYAQLITPDTGAAAFGVAAAYCFWRWLQQPIGRRAVVAGLALGLAELCKTTWVLLLSLWPLLWAVWQWKMHGTKTWTREALQLALILLIALWLINLGYGFEGSFDKLGNYRFRSKFLRGAATEETAAARGNRFAASQLGELPIPLPGNYVLGMDQQKDDFERKKNSYLRGEWRLGGWWYYYLYALAVKLPLGTLGLLLVALVCRLVVNHRSSSCWDEVVLLAAPVAVLAFVSSQTGFNHHLRYVLPAFPFVFIWIGQVASPQASRWVTALAAVLLAGSIVSSLRVYPHNLAYFNELAGGPTHGHEHLLHSNIDWGQDLFFLRRWQEEHPEARDLYLAYDGRVPPAVVGIQSTPAPAQPMPGWFAVSVNRLRGIEGTYAFFLRFRPVAMAGYSIYIYHLTAAEADEARCELGLSRPLNRIK